MEALIFVSYDLGFVPRCALEEDDGGQMRLQKIESIIEQCQFGIHDLSAVALDERTQLPRFNMPLELGLFLGCRRYGNSKQKKKKCLILDAEQFRYRTFISDISGQDIHAHGGQPHRAISAVRNWVATALPQHGLEGGTVIAQRFEQFQQDLPALCRELRREREELIFVDLSEMIRNWLRANR